jgi:hypothetical protein
MMNSSPVCVLLNVCVHWMFLHIHHDSFGKLKVTIMDHNPKWDDKSKQERESFWIRKLKTLSPNGINEKK